MCISPNTCIYSYIHVYVYRGTGYSQRHGVYNLGLSFGRGLDSHCKSGMHAGMGEKHKMHCTWSVLHSALGSTFCNCFWGQWGDCLQLLIVSWRPCTLLWNTESSFVCQERPGMLQCKICFGFDSYFMPTRHPKMQQNLNLLAPIRWLYLQPLCKYDKQPWHQKKRFTDGHKCVWYRN